jgi:hypothetical protein
MLAQIWSIWAPASMDRQAAESLRFSREDAVVQDALLVALTPGSLAARRKEQPGALAHLSGQPAGIRGAGVSPFEVASPRRLLPWTPAAGMSASR